VKYRDLPRSGEERCDGTHPGGGIVSPMLPLAVSGRIVIVVAVVAAIAFAAFLLRSES
jgi:hypothetical protein